MAYFHKLEDNNTGKFWSITLNGCDLDTRYGTIKAGEPRSSHKSLATPEKAQKEYDKLIRQKLADGYSRPDLFATPTGVMQWSDKLLANRPIIRGLHVPPLSWELSPFAPEMLHITLAGYKEQWAYKGKDVVIDLQPLQEQIIAYLAGDKDSIRKEDWANCKLLQVLPKKSWLSSESIQRLLECQVAFFQRAVLLLGTLPVLEMILLYLQNFSRITIDGRPEYTIVLDVLRHAIANLDDAQHAKALNLAKVYCPALDLDNIKYIVMLAYLFPHEQHYAKAALQIWKSADFTKRRGSLYDPYNSYSKSMLAQEAYFQELMALAERPERSQAVSPFTLRLQPFPEELLQLHIAGYDCEAYRGTDITLNLKLMQQQIQQLLMTEGDGCANFANINTPQEWHRLNLLNRIQKKDMLLLDSEGLQRFVTITQAIMERAIFIAGPVKATLYWLDQICSFHPHDVLRHLPTLTMFRQLMGSLPVAEYRQIVEGAKKLLHENESYSHGAAGVSTAIYLIFMTDRDWPTDLQQAIENPDFPGLMLRDQQEAPHHRVLYYWADLLAHCQLTIDDYLWLERNSWYHNYHKLHAIWATCLGQGMLPLLQFILKSLTSNNNYSRADYERNKEKRVNAAANLINILQSDEALKVILNEGSDEHTLDYIYMLASRYPLYLKGILESSQYGLSDHNHLRLRQFIELIIA